MTKLQQQQQHHYQQRQQQQQQHRQQQQQHHYQQRQQQQQQPQQQQQQQQQQHHYQQRQQQQQQQRQQYHPQHAPPHPHPHTRPPPPHQPPYSQPKPAKPRRSSLASCIVATIFLLFITILIFIIYFSLFKPKDPKITITSIQFPIFTVSANSTTVSFIFSQYAAVRNPNRAVFTHFDSSLQLLYAGNQVGFMFIPAGKISAGKTQYMDATFSVQSFPLVDTSSAKDGQMMSGFPAMVVPPLTDGVDQVQTMMEMEVRMEMIGRVRVLWFFNHHIEASVHCLVDVAIHGGSVLGFHC